MSLPWPVAVLSLVLLLLPASGSAPASPLPARVPSPSTLRVADYPRWLWPTPVRHDVLRPFVAPATRYGAGHRGIDIPADVVIAPADGTVHFAGDVFGRGVLSLRHDDGLVSSFEPVETALQRGDAVLRGQVVAQVAPPAGHCAAGCLHVGVRLNGEYVSPMNFFGDVPRSVLLPTRRR